MKYILTFLMGLAMVATAHAGLQSKAVRYTHAGTELVGYMAWDDRIDGKRPGVLVIHEWWGLNDYARMRTDQLARMGYVAFAVDMYGGGKSTTDRGQAAEWAKGVRGTPLMRDRALAGLQLLASDERVDPNRLAAIGFCFGGTGVLELAYSGADVAGVVSFHGGLFPPSEDDMARIKSPLLILHGAADPYVKQETIADVQSQLEAAGVDWQMIYYAHAVHAFTNPEAGNDPTSGVAYQQRAAERSWKHMQLFFDEIFAKEKM